MKFGSTRLAIYRRVGAIRDCLIDNSAYHIYYKWRLGFITTRQRIIRRPSNAGSLFAHTQATHERPTRYGALQEPILNIYMA